VEGRWLPLAGGLGVALLLASLTAPVALSRWWLSPDAIEYLAVAHAWVHGAGFVDPVRWNFFLDARAPLPAFAVRAPALSVLVSLPLGLGAGVTGVGLFHALFASAVAGALVPVARRSMGTGSALATALVLGLSPAWLRASTMVLSEVTGVAALLLVIATARGVLRSVPGALLCAVATLLAWCARPNLLALFLAVAVAALVELGPRRALRHRPLLAYLVALALLSAATRIAVQQITGLAPYAGYGVASEIFSADEAFAFQKEYVGALAFAGTHAAAVIARSLEFGAWLVRELCLGARFHFVGWLLLPGLVHSFLRRGHGAFEQRIAALAGIGFAATSVAYFAAFDPWRYPIFAAVCALLAGMAWLDAGAARLAARPAIRAGAARLVRAAPLVACVALLLLFRLPSAAERAAGSFRSLREHGTLDGGDPPARTRGRRRALGRGAVLRSGGGPHPAGSGGRRVAGALHPIRGHPLPPLRWLPRDRLAAGLAVPAPHRERRALRALRGAEPRPRSDLRGRRVDPAAAPGLRGARARLPAKRRRTPGAGGRGLMRDAA